jgi:DNA-binding SARP family transcriptional activator
MYLTILDKLVAYHRERGEYEAGIAFGTLALRSDRARERTHQSLMTLRLLAGDRTGALRQYERCVSALREELDIAPAQETEALLRSIKGGEAAAPAAYQGSSPLLVIAEGPPMRASKGTNGRRTR